MLFMGCSDFSLRIIDSQSKSTLHAMTCKIALLGKKFMDEAVSATMSGTCVGRLHGDSMGLGLCRHVDW